MDQLLRPELQLPELHHLEGIGPAPLLLLAQRLIKPLMLFEQAVQTGIHQILLFQTEVRSEDPLL